MNKTKIEYLDMTWNPIAMRCTPVSPGCAHCWHLRMADRLAGNDAFAPEVRAAYAGEGPPVLVGSRLEEPLRRREPAVIGVQWMGDLFHEDVEFADIWFIWKAMRKCQQHTFQILTKRIERAVRDILMFYCAGEKPLPNVWLGVSVENLDYLWRIGELLKCPTEVRFVSLEPLLGPIHLKSRWMIDANEKQEWIEAVPPSLDWVIIGGEGGPGARPMHLDWVRDLLEQCRAAGVPAFVKQLGSAWAHEHGGDAKGGDPSLWPADLRVREMSAQRGER